MKPAGPRSPVRSGSLAALIPKPLSVRPGTGSFLLTAEVVLVVTRGSGATGAACLLRDALEPATGLRLDAVGPGDVIDGQRRITFTRTRADVALGPEGYRLHVTPTGVDVVARNAAGFGWAVQTLLQSAAPEVASTRRVAGTFALPAVTVRDVPRYRWRGLMLDVARHFFGPAEVERVIDLMATYKLNILHLHLTDDQGWRIEIKAHPELTRIGGRSEVGGGPGGFFTQRQYRALVAYAARRGITVVPEIDLPGHTNAALASIPELNCDGTATRPYTEMAVGFSSLCIGRPATERFVHDVMREVAALTPGRYVHLGGDESHATAAADFEAFIARAAAIVRGHGKTPVGWEEIGRAKVGSDAVAQHWLDAGLARQAAGQGAGIVLSPSSRVYFDMAYGDFAPAGNSWAGRIDTRKAYDWDPATFVTDLPADQVLGVEAPLWTELVESRQDIEHRLLPRLPGLAEVGWSAPEGRSWDEYRERVAAHAARWTAAGRVFTRDPGVPWPR